MHDRQGDANGSVRRNQVFAVGGLPLVLLERERARLMRDTIERLLLTPLGLRTLDAADSTYCARYEGGVRERDGAYHQGTVWPWLMGSFVEAWVRVRDCTSEAKTEARQGFVAPLLNKPH